MAATGESVTTGAIVSMINEELQQLLLQVQAGQQPRELRKLKYLTQKNVKETSPRSGCSYEHMKISFLSTKKK